MMPRNNKYQEMCIKAQDIQSLWKKEYGDQYVTLQQGGHFRILLTRNDSDKRNLTKYPCFWLPDQYALQQMVIESFGSQLYGLMQQFVLFLKNQCVPIDIDTTPEELWLKYVMKHKFGKQWDGNDWMVMV